MSFTDWLLGRPPAAEASRDAADVAAFSSLSDLIVGTRLNGLMSAQVDYQKVPAIVRAKTMTEKVIASFPVAAWRGTDRVPEQPSIVANPNPDQTRREFLEETVDSMQRGEAYWYLDDYRSVFPTTMRVIPDNRVQVTWNEDRSDRVYTLDTGRVLRHTGAFRNLAVVPVGRGSRNLTGNGPLNSDRLSGIIAALNYIQEFFENNGNPTGILRKTGNMTAEEAANLKRQWVEARTTRTPAVLAGNLEWNSTSFNPADSAWVDAYMATVLDVANLWGIPPSILGFNSPGSSLRYENTQDSWEAWWRGTLQPIYLATIESEWSRLVPRGQDVRFSSQSLTRLSAEGRADFYTKALDPETGWLTREEVRELEGISIAGGQLVERDTTV